MAKRRCQQAVHGVIRVEAAVSELKVCCDCKLKISLSNFPSKGKGRREKRCNDCHNSYRRNRYSKITMAEPFTVELPLVKFSEEDVVFNQILDLITQDILNEAERG